MKNNLVLVRGGGDIASGTIHRLYKSGFKVVVLEIEKPTVIRRTVSFAEAVYSGEITIEGVVGKRAKNIDEVNELLDKGIVPILIDQKGDSIKNHRPNIVVDAILAKRNIGTNIDMAPIVIGLGPGFEADKDVHGVIETNRGHSLGRTILKGCAETNTGIPGNIDGYSWERVLRAPKGGEVSYILNIGDMVKKGDLIGYSGDKEILAPIDGVIRGLIKEGLEITEGFKIGDIDPRGIKEYCFTISDKARAIAGGVLEAIMYFSFK